MMRAPPGVKGRDDKSAARPAMGARDSARQFSRSLSAAISRAANSAPATP